MGDHKTNPLSQAKAAGNQIVQAMDLGEDIGLLGVQLIPAMDEKRENLVVLLCAVGGRKSAIVGMEPRPVVISELAKVPLEAVRKALGGGAATVETPADPVPAEEISEAAPPATSGLVLVP